MQKCQRKDIIICLRRNQLNKTFLKQYLMSPQVPKKPGSYGIFDGLPVKQENAFKPIQLQSLV